MNKILVEITTRNRILASTSFEDNDDAKRIAGYRPRFKRGAGPGGRDKWLGWTYPLTMETCRSLRRVFKDRLQIGPELSAWALTASAAQSELQGIKTLPGEDAWALLGNLDFRAPRLARALWNRPFQANGALFAARASAGSGNLDEPGLGKTLQALAAATERGCRSILVLCRSSAVTSVWDREIQRWLGGNDRFRVLTFPCTGTRGSREVKLGVFDNFRDAACVSYLICNIEMARIARICENGKTSRQCKRLCEHETDPVFTERPDYPQLFAEPWDAIICDESHRAVVGSSAKSDSVSMVRLGMTQLPLAEGGMRLALSGTPARGDNRKFWGTLNWLDPAQFGSYWRFMEDFFEVETGPYEEKIVGQLKPYRQKAFDRILSTYFIRRTKPEVAPDMPPKLYAGSLLDPRNPDSPHGVWLEMTTDQRQAYEDMQAWGDAQIEGGRVMAVGTLAEMTRLKQFACSACQLVEDPRSESGTRVMHWGSSNKLEWLLEFLEDLDGAGKVVVASQFTGLLGYFSGKLLDAGHPHWMLTGETSPKQRLYAQDQFQQGDASLILVNTLAGGESINLSKASYMVFLDETWIPDEQEQMENRGDRLGDPSQLTVYYLRSLGTLEEEIAKVTGAREGAIKQRIDGSRGVEIRKQMIRA